MKILFASSSSGSRGGGETFLVYLGEALAKRGHEVMLWTSSHPRMDDIAARFAPFGSVHRTEYTNTYDRPRRSLSALLDRDTPPRVATEWAALKPDLIHINKQNLEDGLDLMAAIRRTTTPTVCTVHMTQSAAYLGARAAWLRDWVSRRCLRGYRGTYVAVSEPRKADMEKFMGAGINVVAIPNGVPIPSPIPPDERDRCRAEIGLTASDLAVLAVGRMTAQKRPFLFLDTAARIAARVSNAKFFWVGDGELTEEWKQRASALGLDSRARALGWRNDAAKLLQCGDLFLHTAGYEGLSLAILEAMAAGVPCAITEELHGEMPFLDEGNSICVKGDAWIDLLQNRDDLNQRAKAARALAVERFSIDAMADAYERLYLVEAK
jgi:glycosyltransferase involved in cell wall biosynthesis